MLEVERLSILAPSADGERPNVIDPNHNARIAQDTIEHARTKSQ